VEKTIPDTVAEAGRVEAPRQSVVKRAGEALFFTGVILLSSLAVIAIAVAAPFVLAASALAGLVTNKKSARGWRPVSA